MRQKRARAQVRRMMTLKKKDEPERILKDVTMPLKLPSTSDIVGDANANIGRSRTIKLAVPDSYGTSISSTVSVSLSCNQDNKTIQTAAKLCARALDKLMEEDKAEMIKFVKELQ